MQEALFFLACQLHDWNSIRNVMDHQLSSIILALVFLVLGRVAMCCFSLGSASLDFGVIFFWFGSRFFVSFFLVSVLQSQFASRSWSSSWCTWVRGGSMFFWNIQQGPPPPSSYSFALILVCSLAFWEKNEKTIDIHFGSDILMILY